MFDPELECFKTSIDLRLIAAALGYAIDKRESCRSSTVMRRDHDKVIISRKPDGVYTYWSVRDDADHGTVIDFVSRRKNLNLGQIRKGGLRAWRAMPTAPLPALPELTKTAKDSMVVQQRFAVMKVARRHPYLEQARAIPERLLVHRRFADRIKIDRYGAAVFPHTDTDGNVCGYELKNMGGWTGFASGGRKGIFLSNASATDRRLILTEGGIDALSYAVLFDDLESTRYGSIGGKMTGAQGAIIRAAILAMPKGSEIVAATDADEAGRQLAEALKEIFDSCGRADLTFRREQPVGGKDWNEILQRRSKSPLPPRPGEPQIA